MPTNTQTSRTLPDLRSLPPRKPRVPAAAAVVIILSVTPPGDDLTRLYDRVTLKPSPEIGGKQTVAATSFAWSEETMQAQEIETRLAELRAAAVEEVVPWSDESEEALRTFLRTYRQPRRPMIVHLSNGNLRAIWKQGSVRHVGLQFIGRDDVRYVMLSRRPGAEFVSQVTGRDTVTGAIEQLRSLDLYNLIMS